MADIEVSIKVENNQEVLYDANEDKSNINQALFKPINACEDENDERKNQSAPRIVPERTRQSLESNYDENLNDLGLSSQSDSTRRKKSQYVETCVKKSRSKKRVMIALLIIFTSIYVLGTGVIIWYSQSNKRQNP